MIHKLNSNSLVKAPYIKETKRLFGASSAWGHGAVKKEETLPLLKKLQSHAAKGVLFTENLLQENCWGGTCSAQSLNFAERFNYSKGNDLHERVCNAAEQCTESSLALRTEQAALNAITKDVNIKTPDFSRAKVESIVALRDYKVDYASDSIPTNNFGKIDFNDFAHTVEQLPEGIFFIRILSKNSNHKEESYGHSVLFLNFAEGHYFWDPMGGLVQLADFEVTKELYNIVGGTSSRWGLEDPRFYRITKKGLSSKLEDSIHSVVKNWQTRLS